MMVNNSILQLLMSPNITKFRKPAFENIHEAADVKKLLVILGLVPLDENT